MIRLHFWRLIWTALVYLTGDGSPCLDWAERHYIAACRGRV